MEESIGGDALLLDEFLDLKGKTPKVSTAVQSGRMARRAAYDVESLLRTLADERRNDGGDSG
jgi:hypothetical protein